MTAPAARAAAPVERGPGTCAHCGRHTRDGIIRWVTRNTAPDARTVWCADPDQCRPIR